MADPIVPTTTAPKIPKVDDSQEAIRQEAISTILMHLFAVLALLLFVGVVALAISDSQTVTKGGIGVGVGAGFLVFIAGNVGGYVSLQRSLNDLSDADAIAMSRKWWPIIVPPLVGGILALVLYLVFLGQLIGGDLVPKFDADLQAGAEKGISVLLEHHALQLSDYAKLLFWSFIAGFNQRYVVDIINSIKPQGAPKSE
jgi:hypothetical protein